MASSCSETAQEDDDDRDESGNDGGDSGSGGSAGNNSGAVGGSNRLLTKVLDVGTSSQCSHSEIDILLKADSLGCRPIDVMSMRLNIKTKPAALSSVSIQLGPICIVHPNSLTEVL